MECRTCTHPERRIIDEGIKRGTQLSVLAQRFDLSEDTLSRHRAEHTEGRASLGVDPGDLLASLLLNKEAAELAVIESIEQKDKTAAMREVRQTTEAIAKLTGAYNKASPKQMLPFWNKLRNSILTALKPFPEARKAVLDAIDSVELE